MTILAIANQKGGVGKTTTAVHIAKTLALHHNLRVLLVDMDAQGNATTSFGIDKRALKVSIFDVLTARATATDAIIHTDDVDVLPANRDLVGATIELMQKGTHNHLAQALSNLDYDVIVIDCAPSLDFLTINALIATQHLIIPMQCEYYALEGIADLIQTVETLKRVNRRLSVLGVVRTLYDGRNMLAKDVSANLDANFGKKMFLTHIPRSVRLAEAPSYGKSVFEMARTSKAAAAYQALGQEIVARLGIATNGKER